MTIDPLLSTQQEVVVWDLEDGSPMPETGARFIVVKEEFTAYIDGKSKRTIRRIKLVD